MLDTVRLGSQKVSKKEYKVRFKELINKLVVLQQEAKRQELGVVVLFEGKVPGRAVESPICCITWMRVTLPCTLRKISKAKKPKTY